MKAEGGATPAAGSSPAVRLGTILWIGLLAGTLDITDNLVYNQSRGVSPQMVFQFIASGLIGAGSFRAGWLSVALGVALHYFIALSWTTIFYAASRKFVILSRRPVVCGLLYGGFVYLFMNYIVLPLSGVPHLTRRISLAARINAVLAVVLLIGLTISLLLRRYAPPLPTRSVPDDASSIRF